MLANIFGSTQNALIAAGLVFALGIAIKNIPGMLEKQAKDFLDKMFAKGDAADDAFMVAAINYAEAKFGAGTGEVKADFVVEKIISLLLLKYRVFMTDGVKAKAKELFHQSFDRLEAAALEARKQQQNP